VDSAGIDMLLVGDSVGMVVHGHDTTLPVTVEVIEPCKVTAIVGGTSIRLASNPFVCDYAKISYR